MKKMVKFLIVITLLLYSLSFSIDAQEIHEAVRKGDLEQVKKLLSANKELISYTDREGNTPLHIAANEGHKDIAGYLINLGADVNAQNKFKFTPLHNTAANNHREAAELLINNGADLNARDWGTWTPLHRAAMQGYNEIIDLILNNGGDKNSKTNIGMTPLYMAVYRNRMETVKLLIRRGADINEKRNDGENLLHVAAAAGHKEMAEFLINKGLDVNITKRYNVTPLQLATVNGNRDIVELLIMKGADVNYSSDDNRTPLLYAESAGFKDITELLLARGAKRNAVNYSVPEGKYFGLKRPGIIPQLFANNILLTLHRPHGNLIFSPDGNEIFWDTSSLTYGDNRNIWFMKQENGRWQPPRILSLMGDYSTVFPFLSYDGKKLFFTSNCPLEKNGKPKDNDIWYVERKGNDWIEPRRLGPAVNSDKMEIGISVAKNGNLYFYSPNREDGKGSSDIYVSKFINNTYTMSENLGGPINTEYSEAVPFVAPDESYIMFLSNRPGTFGGGNDLYISFRKRDGSWKEAINMGPEINSAAHEFAARVSPDGKYLFFTSRKSGVGEFYWVNAKIIEQFKPKELE